MSHNRTAPRPRMSPSSAAPPRALPDTARLVDEALRHLRPDPPGAPPWSHRLIPGPVRQTLAELGWWNNPVPQPPSGHLDQVLAVLEKYGWCQSLDTDLRGRLCIRGAQNLLQNTGHVTPAARARAVDHMQTALHRSGITLSFFTWNDLPGQEFSHVRTLIRTAARNARRQGE
ncbi:hypothetical protein GPZ77_34520 (plasmid) [Streptomyces sp. QHH-9511]|uniref:DUF6197 family protein n=1 Tax=Streptomyces sp. QHH-9511 TaxID=2684468 RepID=UPI0013193E24|nr:hypothetical protein [Streptomyces sp. QHH-9511]QGZ53347.1 hypothetical protein GPZ77_34520 [Streptomyces sp. QHH-9511]